MERMQSLMQCKAFSMLSTAIFTICTRLYVIPLYGFSDVNPRALHGKWGDWELWKQPYG